MTARAYYNEINEEAAATLEELIKAGHIAPGDVDRRSIEDVRPDDLRPYTQCHFFAGFGIWSLAFRRAGIPDDYPVWSGSCPCQPFSSAGKGDGFADERHLWPAFLHLIQHGKRPEVPVYGEQVASNDGLAWLDLVQADLEGSGYTVRPFDLCAAGFGAPHIRQRLFFVANSERRGWGEPLRVTAASGALPEAQRQEGSPWPGSGCEVRSLGDSDGKGRTKRARFKRHDGEKGQPTEWEAAVETGLVRGFWSDADWVECREPKGTYYRPVEPGTFPLVDGAPSRVGRLRGYGNGIVAPVAEAFIEASKEIVGWAA